MKSEKVNEINPAKSTVARIEKRTIGVGTIFGEILGPE